jgi:hypothetical protein
MLLCLNHLSQRYLLKLLGNHPKSHVASVLIRKGKKTSLLYPQKSLFPKQWPPPPYSKPSLQVPHLSSSGSSKLEILRTRVNKAREEKERLARLQELDYLEAEWQREIMQEQRKEFGVG